MVAFLSPLVKLIYPQLRRMKITQKSSSKGAFLCDYSEFIGAFFVYGARGGIRTHKPIRVKDFKSSA